MALKIAFFGLPLAALMLAREGHEIVLAGLSRSGLPGTRRLRRVLGDERVLVTPKVDRAYASRIRDVDLVVSWFWTKKVPIDVVRAARYGAFGVHPSLLPRWRGADPYFWAIDAGDAVTGVTAHRLEAEYDTGAILGSRSVPLEPTWDAWKLARALDRPSLELLRELVASFAAGTRPQELSQDEALVTAAPEPDDDLLEMDWSRRPEDIVRRVRAAAPYPGAWTFIGDEAVIITRASVATAPRALRRGEAAVVDGRAVVAAGAPSTSHDVRREGVALHAGRRVHEDDREEPLDEAQLAAIVAAARVCGEGA